MAITLDGTTGITTPGLTNTGSLSIVNFTTSGNTILGDASTDTLNVGNGGLVKDASGNVGIGTASPSGKLQVLGPNGTAENEYRSFTVSGSSGNKTVNIAYDAVNDIGVIAAADAGVNWKSLALCPVGGKVGINLSAPDSTLTVNGQFSVGAAPSGRRLYMGQNGTNTYIQALSSTSTAEGLAFFNGGTQTMMLNSSGNLGLGTTSTGGSATDRQLTVLGTTAQITTSNNNTYSTNFGVNAANLSYLQATGTTPNLALYTGSTERMRIDSSGNVGIGVTPSAWGTSNNVKALQIPGGSIWSYSSSPGNMYVGNNYYFNGTNRLYLANNAATEYSQQVGQHLWYTAPSGTAGNAITFTQAMTLDASSNLSVGGTVSAGYITLKGTKIEATTNASSGAYVNLITTANLAAGTAGTIMIVGAENGNTNTTFYIIQYAKNGNSASVTYTGLNGVALASVGGTSTGNGLGQLTFVQSGTSLQVRAAGYLGIHVVAVITQYPDY
jgi:hypothetical protein